MEKLSREEQETYLHMNALNDVVVIESSVPKDINKFRKLGYEVIQENKYPNGEICSVLFRVPRKAITFRSMESVNRPLSEAQQRSLEAMRLKTSFTGKKTNKNYRV